MAKLGPEATKIKKRMRVVQKELKTIEAQIRRLEKKRDLRAAKMSDLQITLNAYVPATPAEEVAQTPIMAEAQPA